MTGHGAPVVALLGDINADLLLQVDAYPQEGADGIARSQTTQLGGSAVNTAVVLTRLGLRARLLARVGHDVYGGFTLGELAREGVDTQYVQIDPVEPTQTNVIVVSASAERTMFAYRGANRKLDDRAMDGLDGVDHLHISGYAFFESPQRDTAVATVQAASRRSIPVSLDVPAHPSQAAAETIMGLIDLIDLVVTDARDCCLLIPEAQNADDAATTLLSYGVAVVALKRGVRGAVIYTADGRTEIPGFPVSVVDTTGAGDAFCAGMIAGDLWGVDTTTRTVLANSVGAAATTVSGAGRNFPDLNRTIHLLSDAISAAALAVARPHGGVSAEKRARSAAQLRGLLLSQSEVSQ